jgi:hypothetical protein
MKKLLLIPAILLLIGCQVAAPENEENQLPEGFSTIEIYENEKYGFSFEYDSNKYLIDEGGSHGQFLLIEEESEEQCHPQVTFSKTDLSYDEEAIDLGFRIDGDAENIKLADDTNAIRRSGSIVEHLPPCGDQRSDVIFEKDDNVFLVTAFQNYAYELQDQIVSTLKFK